MVEGSVEVWSKNILYWFIEGQTSFGMPSGAKLSLGPSMNWSRLLFIEI